MIDKIKTNIKKTIAKIKYKKINSIIFLYNEPNHYPTSTTKQHVVSNYPNGVVL